MANERLSNKQLLALAKDEPTYKSWTSKLTDEIFTEAGFQEMENNNYQLLADFYNLSVRITLQKIRRPEAKIPSIYSDIVEEYSNEYGGINQRINTKVLKPTSPKYRKLVNGGSIDPFVVRKPETEERFFKQNFDFQNLLTIQDIELKKMFLNEYGISDYIANIMASIDESYNIQKYEVMRELLSKAINSEQTPLQESQKITVPMIRENSSAADQAKFIQVFKSLETLMESTVLSGKFNAKKYEHGMYIEDYTLLVRADVWEIIQTGLMATTYHNDKLTLNFKVKKVKDFGGIYYTDTSDNLLKPVYDDFGAYIGYNSTGEGEPLPEEDIIAVDPNANITAVLIQKGALFLNEQTAYTTQAIYNPAGMYTNFWANKPNGAFNYDACYDLIIFVEEPTP